MGAHSRSGDVSPAPPDRLATELAAEQANLIRELRAVRIARGLSVSATAAALGVDPAQVSRFETGATNPTMATTRRYAQAVGATLRLEAGPWPGPDAAAPRDAEPTVPVSRYPQLRAICWQLAPDAELTEQEALSRYEREWRHVDTAALTTEERGFIDHLARTYAGGVLLV